MITELARAKLNLALHVRHRRDDGYHEIETLFAFCEHGDEVRVAFADTASFNITGPFATSLPPTVRAEPVEAHIPTDSPGSRPSTGSGRTGEGADDNLVTRAAAAFDTAFGTFRSLAIALDKRLPVASGIGGGSADAAATLRAMARLHRVEGDPRLMEIAATLGSDIPACLLGVTAIGSGRGETLVATKGEPGTPTLLVNPNIAVPTAKVFAAWDGIDRGPMPDDPREGRNDLQAPAIAIAPVIGDVLDALTPGATLARMSGSGATCFALYDSISARDEASARIAAAHPDWWRLETALA